MTDCYIEMTPPSTDSCIDLEPTGTNLPAPSDLVFDANQLVHDTEATAVSISGIDQGEPARRVRFTNNTLSGGGIGGVHAADVTIGHNTFIPGRRGQVMVFRGGFDGLTIEGNRIEAPPEQSDGVRISVLDGRSPSRVRIVGNDLDLAGGVSVTDPGSHIELRDNRIRGRGQARGIELRLERTTGVVHRDIRIVGNTITNFTDAGIHLSTSDSVEQFDGVEISANDISADEAPTPNDLVGSVWLRPATVTTSGSIGHWWPGTASPSRCRRRSNATAPPFPSSPSGATRVTGRSSRETSSPRAGCPQRSGACSCAWTPVRSSSR